MSGWPWEVDICKYFYPRVGITSIDVCSYALAADIQTIPGLPTAPGYLNVDIDPQTGEIDGLF